MDVVIRRIARIDQSGMEAASQRVNRLRCYLAWVLPAAIVNVYSRMLAPLRRHISSAFGYLSTLASLCERFPINSHPVHRLFLM